MREISSPVCPAYCGTRSHWTGGPPILHRPIRLRDAQVVFPERICRPHRVPTAFFRSPPNGPAPSSAVVRLANGDKAFRCGARLGVAAREKNFCALHGGLQHLRWQTKEIFANLPHQHDADIPPACGPRPKAPASSTTSSPLARPYWSRPFQIEIAPLCGSPATTKRVSAWRYSPQKPSC